MRIDGDGHGGDLSPRGGCDRQQETDVSRHGGDESWGDGGAPEGEETQGRQLIAVTFLLSMSLSRRTDSTEYLFCMCLHIVSCVGG